jgi:hypothetical protein
MDIRPLHKTFVHINLYYYVKYWCLFAIAFSIEPWFSLYICIILWCYAINNKSYIEGPVLLVEEMRNTRMKTSDLPTCSLSTIFQLNFATIKYQWCCHPKNLYFSLSVVKESWISDLCIKRLFILICTITWNIDVYLL